LKTPELALDRVRLELDRLGSSALQMARQALPTVFYGDEEDLLALSRMDDDVDALYDAIVDYLGQLSRRDLSTPQSVQLRSYMSIANNIESIGDMIETNLVEVGRQRLKYDIQMSKPTQHILKSLHDEVCWAIEQSLKALATSDRRIAAEVKAAKPEVNQIVRRANNHLTRRLAADEPHRLVLFRIESEIVEYLKRVYYFAKRIARTTARLEPLVQ
jgi:phosphate:Na+ symporter